jgi:hypothetical protein
METGRFFSKFDKIILHVSKQFKKGIGGLYWKYKW